MYNARTITNKELYYGHKACGGCGAALAVRLAMKVLGERTYYVTPPSCMSALGFNFPHIPVRVPGFVPPFASAGATISGIRAGAEAQGIKDFNVVAFAGDGGTADIGIQALSGMIDRNDKCIYICLDNEAYMNTGVQRSGETPFGMKTTNTPTGKNYHGNQLHKKRLFEIIAAHGIPYAATASVGYAEDFMEKVEKAKNANGSAFIHVMAPCPTGWGTETDQTIEVARAAFDCGLWYLAEYENDEFRLTKKPEKLESVEKYLKLQGRFATLDEKDIAHITAERDAYWEHINARWK